MKCAECGNENRAGAKFCAKCGKALAEVAAAPGAEGAVEAVAKTAPSLPEKAETAEAAPAAAEPEAEAKPQETAPAAEAAPALEAPKETTSRGTRGAKGSRLLDRYEVIELVESGEAGNVYAAHDLRRCPKCSYVGNEPGSEYCAQCGATLGERVKCLIRQEPSQGKPLIADQFTEGDCLYSVTLEQAAANTRFAPTSAPQGIALRWGKKTDVGRRRDLNEDYLDVRIYSSYAGPTLGLFIVADGIGGQEHGEVASKLATITIWEHLREKVWKPEMSGEAVSPQTMEGVIMEAVQAANQAVYQLRREQKSDMGTTVTMALLRDSHALIANVGDSRTYLWSPAGLKRITLDHSVVEGLVASGEITREQAYTHPQRSLIYRSLGDRPTIEVDTFEQELQAGDRLILCSDGVWEMTRDEGLEEVLLSEPDPQRACDILVDHANLAGGEDNITVIIVQVE